MVTDTELGHCFSPHHQGFRTDFCSLHSYPPYLPRAGTVLSTEETTVNGLETGSSKRSSTLFSPYNCHVNNLLSLRSSGI